MAFFNTVATPEAVEETSGGSYLSKSGIYDVTLKIVSVDVSTGGATSLNFNIDYNGNPTTIYGMYIKDKEGKPMFSMKTFNNLCVVAGLDSVGDPEEQTHYLGKDNKETVLAVLDEFTDFDCKIRVQEEYSKYNGEIRKRLVIKNFYRTDGASASEIVNGTEVGVQIKKDEAYASNITYKDNLTAEEVQAWKDSRKGNAGGEKKTPPTPKSKASSGSNLFA